MRSAQASARGLVNWHPPPLSTELLTSVDAISNGVNVDVYLKGQAYADYVIENVLRPLPHDELMRRIEDVIRVFSDLVPEQELEKSIKESQADPEKFFAFFRAPPITEPPCSICGQMAEGLLPLKCPSCDFIRFTCHSCHLNKSAEGFSLGEEVLRRHMLSCKERTNEFI